MRPMNSRKGSPIAIATEALRLAEDGLVDLPMSPHVRELHRRIAALKRVLHGAVRDILTREQHRRLAQDAMALANEVLNVRSLAAG